MSTDEVRLSTGEIVLVDAEDLSLVRKHSWHASRKRTVVYARTSVKDGDGPNRRSMPMHRLILGVTDPRIEVDHINGNGLDNRRSNLRLATHADNSANRRK